VAAGAPHTLRLARETEKVRSVLYRSKRCLGERVRRMEGETGRGRVERKPVDGKREYQLQVH
jgi:hypothetical protein